MKFTPLCFGLCLVSVIACKRESEIKSYNVAKEVAAPAIPAAPASAADPHAGIPGMAGMTAGAAGMPAAAEFTDSPPAHWKKQALSPMRLASYHVEGEGGAMTDISFSLLRRAPGGILANVNRWRAQVGQAPVDEAALKPQTQVIKSSFGDALAVDIEGLASGGDALKDGRLIGVIAEEGDNAWFFKMRGNAALTATEKTHFYKWIESVKPAAPSTPAAVPGAGAAPAAAAPAAAAPAADGSLSWAVPDGWVVAPATATRYATLSVAGGGGAKAELAISHFPGDVGGDLANVNRWRQQIGLAPVDAAALPPLVTKLSAGSASFSLIDASGAAVRMVAAWTRHGADTWFFKFSGPAELVEAEKAKFTAFIESVRFTKPE